LRPSDAGCVLGVMCGRFRPAKAPRDTLLPSREGRDAPVAIHHPGPVIDEPCLTLGIEPGTVDAQSNSRRRVRLRAEWAIYRGNDQVVDVIPLLRNENTGRQRLQGPEQPARRVEVKEFHFAPPQPWPAIAGASRLPRCLASLGSSKGILAGASRDASSVVYPLCAKSAGVGAASWDSSRCREARKRASAWSGHGQPLNVQDRLNGRATYPPAVHQTARDKPARICRDARSPGQGRCGQ